MSTNIATDEQRIVTAYSGIDGIPILYAVNEKVTLSVNYLSSISNTKDDIACINTFMQQHFGKYIQKNNVYGNADLHTKLAISTEISRDTTLINFLKTHMGWKAFKNIQYNITSVQGYHTATDNIGMNDRDVIQIQLRSCDVKYIDIPTDTYDPSKYSIYFCMTKPLTCGNRDEIIITSLTADICTHKNMDDDIVTMQAAIVKMQKIITNMDHICQASKLL